MKSLLLMTVVAGTILASTAQAQFGKLGLWECTLTAPAAGSFFGRDITESGARMKAARDCNQSGRVAPLFCDGNLALCQKSLGFKGGASYRLMSVACSMYEAFCSGIGGSSGYGSTPAEARANMGMNCIPVTIRCVQ